MPTASRSDRDASVRGALERCRDVLSESVDASNTSSAEKVISFYASFDALARAAFFDGLIEAPRRELFLRLSGAPGAAAWLVRMRQDLCHQLHHHPAWTPIERELTQGLKSLFHHGVLDFQRIDLETPSSVLERLIDAEAVHAINDRREMARRLEADRRCYAFFHPRWPDEPIIFTEVALTREIVSTIRPILDPDSAVADPRTCNTAMFYSISSCQPGLRGFSFGNALLVRAVEQLRTEMPWLRRFATISPIPGFRSWLSTSAASLNRCTGVAAWLSNERSQDAVNDAIPDALQGDLLALCAHYLLRVKQGREPADPVARFHLGNGARLHRLNSSSDLSVAGMRRSAGFTVNYVYKPNELARNAEAYGRRYTVRAVAEVARLARLAAPLLSTPSS